MVMVLGGLSGQSQDFYRNRWVWSVFMQVQVGVVMVSAEADGCGHGSWGCGWAKSGFL